MIGNAYQWCEDRYGDYDTGAVTDPTGAEMRINRVTRGGSWFSRPVDCRSANRHGEFPDLRNQCTGFRVVVTRPASELTLDLGEGVPMKFVQIPAGTFQMGSPETEENRRYNENMHQVTISRPFYMGVYEVTVDQYARFVMDTRREHDEPAVDVPGLKQKGNHPAVYVSWDDAQAFCTWLSKRTGKTVALPTEAQWEYACRAGSRTRFSFGDRDEDLPKYGNYHDNAQANNSWRNEKHGDGFGTTTPVGSFKPNGWGLYDMHGNAFEWCSDLYTEVSTVMDRTAPMAPAAGFPRVVRGGSWISDPWICRSASRSSIVPGSRDECGGFRVVMLGD